MKTRLLITAGEQGHDLIRLADRGGGGGGREELGLIKQLQRRKRGLFSLCIRRAEQGIIFMWQGTGIKLSSSKNSFSLAIIFL